MSRLLYNLLGWDSFWSNIIIEELNMKCPDVQVIHGTVEVKPHIAVFLFQHSNAVTNCHFYNNRNTVTAWKFNYDLMSLRSFSAMKSKNSVSLHVIAFYPMKPSLNCKELILFCIFSVTSFFVILSPSAPRESKLSKAKM